MHFGLLLSAVPARVWNLHASDGAGDTADVSMDRKDDDRDRETAWWNQASLTQLDLSSNVLRSIDTGIGNLLDLTVLNVSVTRNELPTCESNTIVPNRRSATTR